MEATTAFNETKVREMFSELTKGSLSSLEAVSTSWFVTFSSGEAALEAWNVATSKNVAVKFKTTAPFATGTATMAVPPMVTPAVYAYPMPAQEYAYWEGPQYGSETGYYNVRAPRGGAPPARAGGAGGYSTHSGAYAPGAVAGGRSGHAKPKGRQHPNHHSALGGPMDTSGTPVTHTGTTGTLNANPSAAPGAGRPRNAAPRFNASGVTPTSPSSTGATAANSGQATSPQSAQPRQGNRRNAPGERKSRHDRHNGSSTQSGRASSPHTGGASGHTSGKHGHGANNYQQDKANLSLASFPPLVHPSGANHVSHTNNGYGAQSFLKYNRETILSIISSRDAASVQRPEFDNADAPILLSSPQLDLEINKPLPVGAKFEPLATDKRTRSLSRKSDSGTPNAGTPATAKTTSLPSQPTTAQIVAAAAAKAQAAPKVVSAKPISTKATAPSTKTAPSTNNSTHGKKPESHGNKSAAPSQASKHSNAHAGSKQAPTTTTAPATTPAAPTALSWADRARAPPAPQEKKKQQTAASPPVTTTPPPTSIPAESDESVPVATTASD